MNNLTNIKVTCFCSKHNRNYNLKYHYKKKPKNETKFNLNYKKYERFLFECQNCNHIFSKHKYDLTTLYSNDYLVYTYKNTENIYKKFLSIMSLPKNKSDNKNRVLRINSFIKKNNFKNRNLLDIGAGIGVFGKSMQLRGWNVSTVETNKTLVNYLNKLNLNSYLINKSNKFKLHGKKFDLIVLNKILEHVEKPISYLNYIKKFLNNNGVIYIEVPDVNATKLGKSREEFYIEHYHIFSKNSLDILLKKNNLKSLQMKSIVEPSGKFTLFTFCVKY